MLFERFDDPGLSQYSYAVGCERSGLVAIVDPRRDIDVYLEFAQRRQLRIAHVLETHIHADFASGARELAERSGATLHLSAYDRGEQYEVAFPHEPVHDGDRLTVGRVVVEALHTPGHTPEHVAFLLYDTARTSAVPEILLSGDFLFVGSVGRPDLIGKDATRALALRMHESVQRLKGLPDGLEVHPGHGAGSMCGAGMGERPMSTLGFERIANPLLDPSLSREAFVERLLSALPPFPPYYTRMKAINARGPRSLQGLPQPAAVAPARFRELAESGHVVIDLRDQVSFGAGHVPGAFGIGAGLNLSTWAGWVVPYDTPILLVAGVDADVDPAVRSLVRVGLDDIVGTLDGGMDAWRVCGYPVATTRQQSPAELHEWLSRAGEVRVLDVRSDAEWSEGHVCGAMHVMGGDVPQHAADLAADSRPLAVMCGTGYRSTVAASVLQRAGMQNVVNVTGGMQAWRQAGLPTCAD